MCTVKIRRPVHRERDHSAFNTEAGFGRVVLYICTSSTKFFQLQGIFTKNIGPLSTNLELTLC